MRTILSLTLALVMGTGVATLTGCNTKKTESEHKVTDKTKTPEGGTQEKTTTVDTETKTKPGDDKK